MRGDVHHRRFSIAGAGTLWIAVYRAAEGAVSSQIEFPATDAAFGRKIEGATKEPAGGLVGWLRVIPRKGNPGSIY